MKKLVTSNTTRTLALAVALLPLAGAVQAGGKGGHGGYCDDSGARHQRHHGDRYGHDGRHGRHGPVDMTRHLDGRMAFLKAEIAITPEQQTEWQAVEEALRAGIERGAKRLESHDDKRRANAQVSAPERLAGHIAAMEARLGQMRAMEDALAGLYAVLDDEQRASADDLLPGGGKVRPFMR